MRTFTLLLITGALFTMVACSRKVGKYEHLPLAEIDTMTLKPGVKSILRKYIKAHPK